MHSRTFIRPVFCALCRKEDAMSKQRIQLSDHFTYQKLLRFTMPSIVMMKTSNLNSLFIAMRFKFLVSTPMFLLMVAKTWVMLEEAKNVMAACTEIPTGVKSIFPQYQITQSFIVISVESVSLTRAVRRSMEGRYATLGGRLGVTRKALIKSL